MTFTLYFLFAFVTTLLYFNFISAKKLLPSVWPQLIFDTETISQSEICSLDWSLRWLKLFICGFHKTPAEIFNSGNHKYFSAYSLSHFLAIGIVLNAVKFLRKDYREQYW